MSKKKQNSPRRKRFTRDQRLHVAKIKWLPTAKAKNLAKSYGKWYGVDMQCAINELEMLGHTYSPIYKEKVKIAIDNKAKEKRRRKEKKEKQADYPWITMIHFHILQGLQKMACHLVLHMKKNKPSLIVKKLMKVPMNLIFNENTLSPLSKKRVLSVYGY